MTDLYYSWANYKQSSPEAQEQILAEMDLDNSLPDMVWEEQGKTFKGAPKEVILKYLPKLADEAQVWVWRKALPVGARPEAMKLLSYEAKISLRLARRIKCL